MLCKTQPGDDGGEPTNFMSKENSTVVQTGGVGICGLAFIGLFVLKLLGKISIGWFWVFSPLLAGPAVIFLILILAALAYLAALVISVWPK